MALPFPKLMQALLIKSHVETRWWLGMPRVRKDSSRMGVLKLQPALFENRVLPCPACPLIYFHLWLFLNIDATKVVGSAEVKIFTVWPFIENSLPALA